MARDQLHAIFKKYPMIDRKQFKIVGVVIDGNHVTGMTFESARGSACIVKRSERLPFPESVSELPSNLFPCLHLSYNVRQILKDIELVISTGNQVSSCTLKKRKAVTPSCFTGEASGSSSKKGKNGA